MNNTIGNKVPFYLYYWPHADQNITSCQKRLASTYFFDNGLLVGTYFFFFFFFLFFFFFFTKVLMKILEFGSQDPKYNTHLHRYILDNE